eukprot:UN21955
MEKWFLPAGHVDPGETFGMCGRRETIEESGVEVELTGVSHIQHNCNNEYIPLHVVILDELREEIKTFKDSESNRAFWRNFRP